MILEMLLFKSTIGLVYTLGLRIIQLVLQTPHPFEFKELIPIFGTCLNPFIYLFQLLRRTGLFEKLDQYFFVHHLPFWVCLYRRQFKREKLRNKKSAFFAFMSYNIKIKKKIGRNSSRNTSKA